VVTNTIHGIKRRTYNGLPKWAKEAIKIAYKNRLKEKVKRGGQASMEFLMTYGWAILVVMAAIGALAYFGVLDSANIIPASCTIVPGIDCEDFRITETGQVEINILNGQGQNLNDISISLADPDTKATLCILTCTEGCSGSNALSNGASSRWSSDNCIISETKGSKFKGELVFEYSLTAEGISHTKKGLLITGVEEGIEVPEEPPLCGGFTRPFCPDMTGPEGIEDGVVNFEDMMYLGMGMALCYETSPENFEQYWKADFNQDCCIGEIDQVCFGSYYGQNIDCATFVGTCPV
jgi:hypothetical protein